MFDEYLQQRSVHTGERFRPFEIATDYRLYVDGKPRYDGVRDFLHSRGIELPEGTSEDPPDHETVRGLGNRKNDMINAVIESEGVEVFEGSVGALVHERDVGRLRQEVVPVELLTFEDFGAPLVKLVERLGRIVQEDGPNRSSGIRR